MFDVVWQRLQDGVGEAVKFVGDVSVVQGDKVLVFTVDREAGALTVECVK